MATMPWLRSRTSAPSAATRRQANAPPRPPPPLRPCALHLYDMLGIPHAIPNSGDPSHCAMLGHQSVEQHLDQVPMPVAVWASSMQLYDIMAKGNDPLLDKVGTDWRSGRRWSQRWCELKAGVDEIRLRSALADQPHGTHSTTCKAAAAMDAERGQKAFAGHCKLAPKRITELKAGRQS